MGRLTQNFTNKTPNPCLRCRMLSRSFHLLFTICYRTVFDTPRPAALLIRGHELHFPSYLLAIYTTAANSNRRTQTFEPLHSNKRIFQPLFFYPAFSGLRLRYRVRAVAFRGRRGFSACHDIRTNMVFVPFTQGYTASKPWSSISMLNTETYSKYTAR